MMARCLTITLLPLLALSAACHSSPSDRRSGTAPTVTATPAAAPLPDTAKLISRIATQDGCKDVTAEMRLTGEAEDGKPVQFEFRVQRKYSAAQTATLLTVTAPREETEKALLAIEKPNQPTDAVSYLAGLKKIAKFKSNSVRDFRGAKIFVQELLGMELNQYETVQAERLMEGNESLIKVTLKEKSDVSLAFPRAEAFFHDHNQQPARIELYDAQNKLIRVARVIEVKEIQKYQTITKVEIEDRPNNRKVKLETLKARYDQSLSDSIFTEASLTKLISEASRKLIK